MPKNVKTIKVVGKKDNISVPLWLAFCMSMALSMGSSPHLAKSKSPLQTNFHICKISWTSGSANPLTHPTEREAVYKSIPNNLTCADLEAIGYQWACYQHFTKNQDRLQCNMVASRASHSPRKRPSSSGSHLFPAESIFCQKLEKKVSGKTERCTKFSVFKEKDGAFREPSWTPISISGDGKLAFASPCSRWRLVCQRSSISPILSQFIQTAVCESLSSH